MSFHWISAASSVALLYPYMTMSLASPALLNRKNLVCAMPCGPRQAPRHCRSQLFWPALRFSLCFFFSPAFSRAASGLGFSSFQFDRSITAWTETPRLWARSSASVMLLLRMFHDAIRMWPRFGTASMVLSSLRMIARRDASVPYGLLNVGPADGVYFFGLSGFGLSGFGLAATTALAGAAETVDGAATSTLASRHGASTRAVFRRT